MCSKCCSDKLHSLLKKFETLKTIIGYIALFEAIIGLIILTTKVVLQSLDYDEKLRKGSPEGNEQNDEERGEELTRIVVMVFLGLQTLFAIILYEGARRKILCMIKTWLIFCFIKLLIPITIILSILFLLNKHEKYNLKSMWWTLSIEITTTIFHIIECIFVLAFHSHVSRSNINNSSMEEEEDALAVYNKIIDKRIEMKMDKE